MKKQIYLFKKKMEQPCALCQQQTLKINTNRKINVKQLLIQIANDINEKKEQKKV